MDKAEVWLSRLLYGVITLLLSHSELLYHVSLALATHIFRLWSSTDPVVHACQHSGPGQMWMELQHFLQQHASRNHFVYCKVEQELRCEKSDEHPKHLEEKATSGGATFDGYVKVQSAPYAYDQGAEAERDYPKSAPLLWFCLPQILGVASSGGIVYRTLHFLVDH